MAGDFPLPVRVVAGALATGLDRIRRLPQDLPGLSVTVAGQAMRASMRVQQEVAQLAGRGEEVLAELFTRPTEHPAWAHFDEDDDQTGGTLDARADGSVDGPVDGPVDSSVDGPVDRTVDGPVDGARDAADRGGDDATMADRPAGRSKQSRPRSRSRADRVAGVGHAGSGEAEETKSAEVGPADMPGYDALRLPQVRARLRALDADAVARLLEHERSGAGRAPFLTVLGNRLTTLRAGDGPDRPA
jgi:hypothetical protein